MWSPLATLARSCARQARILTTMQRRGLSTTTLRANSLASAIPIYTTNTLPSVPPTVETVKPITDVVAPENQKVSTLPSDIQQAAQLLRDQKKHYAVIEIMGRSFLVTKNDIVVIDRLRHAKVGDILEFDRIREIGTMDYTLYGKPIINSEVARVRATVIEEPKSSEIIKIKFKKRKNYHRRLRHRHHYTLLRISDVEVLPVA